MPEASVVGSGPNGLAAAIVLARSGRRVLVLEGEETVGGGCRSAELTLPGFVHDTCSTVHSLALASPFLSELPLERHGLELAHPEAPLAHPLDDGTAVMLERPRSGALGEGPAVRARSVDLTARGLGRDERAYRSLFGPLVRDSDALFRQLLGPLRPPRHPLAMARFGLSGIRSARGLVRSRFETERARALLAGCCAHSMLSLRTPASAAFGIVLAMTAHAVGWPVARGGSQRLTEALVAELRSAGGDVQTGRRVESLDELRGSSPVLLDVTPRQLLRIAGGRLPDGYKRRLSRYRYGPGIFKLDWALDGPIPWRAAEAARAGTVHLGGTLDEIVASEEAAVHGRHHERPFVLLVQPTQFDPTRAPEGKHAGWAYCHVPSGSTRDMTDAIEAQVERFAPGFRDLIAARSAMGSAEVERRNANYVGGDINGGAQDLRQLFTRPVARPVPYSTPLPGLFICSSSTPPGGGVHGMCGYFAARAALRAS
ncbi:MAG TPA: NAD(P)/FAD-dependent oxidoreductase [Thermoleophilaceae bacterium]|nr:NAD(P)/FAD-dependent oxidoreductase [Thermoleophilaceae bacterium]